MPDQPAPSLFEAANGSFRVYLIDEHILAVEGGIEDGSDELFRSALTPSTRRVVLNSVGGSVTPVLNMADEIRSRRLDVEVRGLCASSCANYLFVAGERKVLGPIALVLWHGGPGGGISESEQTSRFRSALLRSNAQRSESEIEVIVQNAMTRWRQEITRQEELYRQLGISTRILYDVNISQGLNRRDVLTGEVARTNFRWVPADVLASCIQVRGIEAAQEPANAEDWGRILATIGAPDRLTIGTVTDGDQLCEQAPPP